MARGEIFVCDTHPLVWFLTRDRQLSEPARIVLRQAQAGEAVIYVPTIVLAEFLFLAIKGKVPWERLFELLIAIEGKGGFQVIALDLETFSGMLFLAMTRPPLNLELHDLSILASAIALDATLITKDRKLRQQKLVPTIW